MGKEGLQGSKELGCAVGSKHRTPSAFLLFPNSKVETHLPAQLVGPDPLSPVCGLLGFFVLFWFVFFFFVFFFVYQAQESLWDCREVPSS